MGSQSRSMLGLSTILLASALSHDAPVWGNEGARQGAAPILVRPATLAEAERPSVELAASGGFWIPGPERFHGWALRDLSDYLQRMTGERYPLRGVDGPAGGGIVAGTLEEFPGFESRQAEWPRLADSTDPEAFLIEAQGDTLYILGKSHAGLIAGIYTLLDRLGCKWYAPGKAWENVPALDGLILDARWNTVSAGPSYQARFFFPSWGPNVSVADKEERARDYTLWNLRNRMGGTAFTANHHNDPHIVPPALFETRPELFALVDGRRTAYALSRANPDTVAMAIDSAVSYLKEHKGRGSYYNSFSVETNDGSPACEWSLQRVAEQGLGRPTATDLNYWFANQVAAGIERAGLTDEWVGMYSYSDHAAVPSFDLHPKVGVLVTTALDSSSDLTVEQRLGGLRERGCRRLGIYHYLNLITWSLDKPAAHPAADPQGLAADLKRWHEHGARSYLAETSDSWINGGAAHYLLSRMLWDIDGDPRKELDAYYKGAFGPAAGEIRALHEDWARSEGQQGLPRMLRSQLARWHEWISTADRKLAGRPTHQARIREIKRYYLYLNLWREFELDLADARLPSKQDRYVRLLRFVGANRGEGALHAIGLLPTLALYNAASTADLPAVDTWGEEFQALAQNVADEAAWKAFAPIGNDEIDRMFAAVRLPLDDVAASGETFDPVLRLAPIDAVPPEVVRFPKLHGPPIPTGPRRYLLRVVAPTPRLTLQIRAGAPLGGGTKGRTCFVTDAAHNEIGRMEFGINEPVALELTDVKPGLYTAVFPDFGAEKLTVSGGNTYGAVRAYRDNWGFNAMRRADQPPGDSAVSYFVVPAGQASLKVALTDGAVTVGFHGGQVIASEVRGSAEAPQRQFTFAASDDPRVAYVQWASDGLTSTGLVIEGVTLYSPHASGVLYETLD